MAAAAVAKQSRIQFEDEADDDFKEKQEVLNDVQSEMMVAMLDIAQGAAAACAQICLEKMVTMRKQMLIAFAEEAKRKSVHNLMDTPSMKKRTSFYDLMGFDRVKTEKWQGGDNDEDDDDDDDDDDADDNGDGCQSYGLEEMFEAMNVKPKPAANDGIATSPVAKMKLQQPRKSSLKVEQSRKSSLKLNKRLSGVGFVGNADSEPQAQQASEASSMPAEEPQANASAAEQRWETQHAAEESFKAEEVAGEQQSKEAMEEEYGERRLTAGAEAMAAALSRKAPSEEELPRWSAEEAFLLCRQGEEGKFEGRAPLLDTNKITSVTAAAGALNEGSISQSGDFCIVYSIGQKGYFVLHRSGRREAALDALALTESGSGTLLIRVLAGHDLPGPPDDSKYVSVRAGRDELKTPEATGDNLTWSSESEPPFRFQVDLSMKDQQMFVLEVFQLSASVGRAEVDIQKVVNKGMCRMQVKLDGGNGKVELEASYIPQVMKVSKDRLIKIVQRSMKIKKVMGALEKPAVEEPSKNIAETAAEPVTARLAAAELDEPGPQARTIKGNQAKKSLAELIAMSQQIREAMGAPEKPAVEEPKTSWLIKIIQHSEEIRKVIRALEKPEVEEPSKDIAETLAEPATTQLAAAELDELGPQARTIKDIQVKKSMAELIAMSQHIREAMRALEQPAVEERSKDIAETAAEPATAQLIAAELDELGPQALIIKGIQVNKSMAELIAMSQQIREALGALEKQVMEERSKDIAETIAEPATTQLAAAELDEPGPQARTIKGIQVKKSMAELIAMSQQIREAMVAPEKPSVEEPKTETAETIAEPATTQLAATAALEEHGVPPQAAATAEAEPATEPAKSGESSAAIVEPATTQLAATVAPEEPGVPLQAAATAEAEPATEPVKLRESGAAEASVQPEDPAQVATTAELEPPAEPATRGRNSNQKLREFILLQRRVSENVPG